ncbi:MAG: hypothetical protein FWF75_01000 [Propionibacteriaceae bacterium]|nr:hypothetical protein [Propionibacteriaceae bacterium]
MTKQQNIRSVLAIAIAAAALFIGIGAASWIAGCLAISAAAASQIVTAIQVGGWALTVVGIVFGLGIGGAIIATVRGLLAKRLATMAVA